MSLHHPDEPTSNALRDGLARLEARANHWHSTRQFFARTDVMHTPLDRWIEQSPRPAGVLITILSLVAVTAFAALLVWRTA